MITQEVLKKLLANSQAIISLAHDFNYTNPRLRMPQEGEYNTLHVLVNYKSGKRKNPTDDETFEDKLIKILGCPVNVAKEGASNMIDYDIEEANKVPLSDREKVTEFFNEYLLPLAQENAPQPPETQRITNWSPGFLSPAPSPKMPLSEDDRRQLNDYLDKFTNPGSLVSIEEIVRQKRQAMEARSNPVIANTG